MLNIKKVQDLAYQNGHYFRKTTGVIKKKEIFNEIDLLKKIGYGQTISRIE